jgi:hypothetical protein
MLTRLLLALSLLGLAAPSAKATLIDLGDLAVGGDGSGSAIVGRGIRVSDGHFIDPQTWAGWSLGAPYFRAMDGTGGSVDLPYVDGVFLAKQSTPIDTLGGHFTFPNTAAKMFDAIRNAAACYDSDNQPPLLRPIRLADQPTVNRRGLGIHSNGGITFDLAAIRNRSEIVDGVHGVAGLGYEAVGSSSRIEIWILVDGQMQFHQSFFGNSGVSYASFQIPLDDSDRFLTFATTDYNSSTFFDHGVIADAVLTPEPASLLLLIGAGASLVMSRRGLKHRSCPR